MSRIITFHATGLTANPVAFLPKDLLANDREFRNFGPDLNILDYVFKVNGTNQDVAMLNDFNADVYKAFHVPIDEPGALPVPIEQFPRYFVTMTTFTLDKYGKIFLKTFIQRVGATLSAKSVNCFRSVVMDPFMPYAQGGNFFITLIEEIDTTVRTLARSWKAKHS